MEFYGRPPIGQKQRRPARPRGIPGAQMGHSFIPPWVGEASGRLTRSREAVVHIWRLSKALNGDRFGGFRSCIRRLDTVRFRQSGFARQSLSDWT
jgi:hypothetical protein